MSGHAPRTAGPAAGPVEHAARAALHEVYDPCSQAWQRPLSLPDLGLVRDVSADDTGRVTVRVSLTVPFCMAVHTIMQAVETRVGAVPGVTAVDVQIDTVTPWSPAAMSPGGRDRLEARRAAELRRASDLFQITVPGQSGQ
ncbi:metal-sulfur cluster assembly factor [Micromonospora sp. DT31]|uniref:metal-sulfur cluster assembly factor n=1 Tax=Micromonospora sp. DT31 TaxID=3393434 RepID=UPI003CF3348C